MAPKRSKKSEVNENDVKYNNLVIEDVLCPICRSILVEPVTLPCSHGFCLSCFNGTMENNALTCPLCRIRIGSWLRTARKEKNIINDRLWKIIQHKFPREIKNKLDGEDELPQQTLCIKLASPGEIRREYEAELQRERLQAAKLQEAEEKASELTIQKILAEEQQAYKAEADKIRLDAEFARRLTGTAEATEPGCSQAAPRAGPRASLDKYLVPLSKKQSASEGKAAARPAITTRDSDHLHSQAKSTPKRYTSKIMCQSQGKKQCLHAYKHLLLTKTLQLERANSNGSDSGDSINQEMRYFKPIRTAPKSVTHTCDGSIVRAPLLKVPSVHAVTAAPPTIRAPLTEHSARIGAHADSAFVPCAADPQSPVAGPSNQATALANPGPSNQATALTDTGKRVKQYYNKKKSALQAALRLSPQPTPATPPWLGFSDEEQATAAAIVTGVAKSMDRSTALPAPASAPPIPPPPLRPPPPPPPPPPIAKRPERRSASVSKVAARAPGSLTPKDDLLPPKKKLLERSLKKLNGCDTDNIIAARSNDEPPTSVGAGASAGPASPGRASQPTATPAFAPAPAPAPTSASAPTSAIATASASVSASTSATAPAAAPAPMLTLAEVRLQEQLDYEYAKRLHEELNNPRTRAFRTLRASPARSRPKRQVTLDELIPPKKFKI